MENIKCEGCGGVVHFDPTTQKLKCIQCERTRDLSTTQVASNIEVPYSTEYSLKEKHEDRHFECESCGSVVILETEDVIQCPSCGNNKLIEKRNGVFIPDGLLPFSINQNDAKNHFKEWIKKQRYFKTRIK